jgi:hypothetical protein
MHGLEKSNDIDLCELVSFDGLSGLKWLQQNRSRFMGCQD